MSSNDIKQAMTELADEPTTLMFHAELALPSQTTQHEQNDTSSAPEKLSTSYSTFLESRPSSYETNAINEILSLSHLAPNLHLHIVHLSAVEAIPALREARKRGVNITAETCFHYLSLAAEEIREGDTRYKCCPPIRSKENQDTLWEEVHRYASDEGVIKTIVSDHSPCTPDLKILPSHIPCGCTSPVDKGEAATDGNFLKAWGGISSVGLGLPIIWTELHRRYNTSSLSSSGLGRSFLEDVVHWCCINTAKQVGLESKKGDLAVGFDGDICVFDDEAEWYVEPSTMLFRNKCSPYQGRKLKGIVRETWVRGKKVFTRETGFVEDKPQGYLLLEPRQF